MRGILKDEGLVKDFEVTKDVPQPQLRIVLKYDHDRKSLVTGLERISKPGRRVYVKRTEIPWVLSSLGIAVLSTPQGMVTDRHERGGLAWATSRCSATCGRRQDSVAYWQNAGCAAEGRERDSQRK